MQVLFKKSLKVPKNVKFRTLKFEWLFNKCALNTKIGVFQVGNGSFGRVKSSKRTLFWEGDGG